MKEFLKKELYSFRAVAAILARWLLLAWFVLPLLAMWVLIFRRVLMTVQMTMQISVATMMPLM